MKCSKKTPSTEFTRRDMLKLSGLALGGLALGGSIVGAGAGKALAQCDTNECNYPVPSDITQEYTYPTTAQLGQFTPNMQTQLGSDEMRITFLGTTFPPTRKAQQMMSIFVEVGPWVPDPNGGFGKATDSFVFDCGAGATTNYGAMGISFGRMDKIFISHLHADHMSDLSAIYCFGPANDRKSPLYVWGQGPSGVQSPRWGDNPPKYYNDGTRAFCEHLREAMRWHTESFSFLPSRYRHYPIPTRHSWGLPRAPIPVGDDPPDDGYALVPIELAWTEVGGVAYNNPTTGVKITHFPVIHTRKGSMGYKLEWNGLTMIYTSDTRPETNCIDQAKNVDPETGVARGVDVFIHEMILPPELLTMKNWPGMTSPPPPGTNSKFDDAVQNTTNIEDSSHTPQGAFGYLLSQINPLPRLTVIAHFPVADDTVKCALQSVQNHIPGIREGQDIIWATDLMVLSVKKSGITQLMGKVSDYTFGPPQNVPAHLKIPKYHTADGQSDPTAQLDTLTLIQPDSNYCENGY